MKEMLVNQKNRIGYLAAVAAMFALREGEGDKGGGGGGGNDTEAWRAESRAVYGALSPLKLGPDIEIDTITRVRTRGALRRGANGGIEIRDPEGKEFRPITPDLAAQWIDRNLLIRAAQEKSSASPNAAERARLSQREYENLAKSEGGFQELQRSLEAEAGVDPATSRPPDDLATPMFGPKTESYDWKKDQAAYDKMMDERDAQLKAYW